MTRLEKYKVIRKHKKYNYLSIIIVLLLLFSGLHIVDHSIGMVMGQKEHKGIIRMQCNGNSLYELYLMNRKICINTAYLEKDIQKMKSLRLFGGSFFFDEEHL